MKRYSLLILLPLLFPIVVAKNDLSQLCFDGVCSVDVQQSPTSMGGTVVLSGSPNAISDITPAAGWEVLNCSSSAAPQTIRLVCTGDSTSCNHLFNNGAENTIIRLPSDCGSGPFAVVAKAAVSSDQSVPHDLTTRFAKRAANTPQVQELSIHTNFSSITNSPHGDVTFAVVGTNIPGALQTITVEPNIDVNKTIGILRDISIGSFNINQSIALNPVNFDNILDVVTEEIDCGSFVAKLDATAFMDFTLEATLGVVASGTVIPPQLNQFALFTDIESNFSGELAFVTTLLGSFDSGQVTLTSIPIPGFELSGIIDVSPSLDLDARVTAMLDIAVDLSYSLPVNLQHIQLVLPPSQGNSGATFSAGPLVYDILTIPNSPADTSLEFELIPTLNVDVVIVGISTTPTNLFLNFDSGITMDLNLEEGADSTDSQFNGCLNVGFEASSKFGFSGPLAALLGAPSGSTGTVFQTSTPNLFQKCFPGTSTRTKRTSKQLKELMASDKPLMKRDLSCPPSDPTDRFEFLDSETVIVF